MNVAQGRRLTGAGVALALVVALAGCGGKTQEPTSSGQGGKDAPKVEKVKVGAIGLVTDAGIYIAQEKGYFKEQNLDVEFVPFDSAAKMVPALSAGQLDVATGAPSAGLNNAAGRDLGLKIVADKGVASGKYSPYVWMVRKDLADQIKDWKDLKGRKVSINGKGIAPTANLAAGLEKGGLTMKDVDLVELAFGDAITAMQNKSLDVAYLVEPSVQTAITKGVAVPFKLLSEVVPDHQIGLILYSAKFAKEHTDAGTRFMTAYLKAVRDFDAAFIDNKADKAPIVSILTKSTTVKDPTLFDSMIVPMLNPNGYVNMATLKSDQDTYVKLGLQEKAVKIEDMVDNQFVDGALKVLGKK